MRKQREVTEQCKALDGEARGALLWALQLADMPPYDEQFEPAALEVALAEGKLRPDGELERERSIARLWHWRARTADLMDEGSLDLPERFSSLDQAVAAAAVRGH